MKNLFNAGRLLLFDMAATLIFLALYLLTGNLILSVALGIALGLGQIGWEIAHKRSVDALQWVSLIVVIASGAATIATSDPRFVMAKPSLIYIAIGLAMLKRGWMNRYLPADALELVPDLGIIFGFVWAGLMFLSAAVNVIVALHFSVAAWAGFMSVYGIATKATLFLMQYAVMRYVGMRRYQSGLHRA